MKRIIWHWSAGPGRVTSLDKKHYHIIFDTSGKRHVGDNPISANARIVKGNPYILGVATPGLSEFQWHVCAVHLFRRYHLDLIQ